MFCMIYMILLVGTVHSYLVFQDAEDSYTISGFVDPTNAVDESWSTYADANTDSSLYENYTLSGNLRSIVIQEKVDNNPNAYTDISCWTYSNSSFTVIGHIASGASTSNFTLDPDCFEGQTLLRTRVEGTQNGGDVRLFENGLFLDYYDVTTNITNPPNNTYSYIKRNHFSGDFYSNSSFELTNSTLYVWFSSGTLYNTNTTTITGTTNDSNLSFSGMGVGDYLWNYYVCGENSTDTLCRFDDHNYTLNINHTIFNSENYNSSTFSSNNESFILNVTFDSSHFTSSIVNLYYNGTEYDTTSTGSGDTKLYSTELTIPSVDSLSNKSFFWSVRLYNGTGSVNYNTSTFYQEVDTLTIAQCNSTVNYTILNFTAYNEGNGTRINFSFEGTFSPQGTDKQFSISNSSANQVLICSNLNETFDLDGVIQYDEDSGTSYVQREYYFDNYEVNNPQEDIYLQLLLSASSTTFIQEVLENQEPISNAYIYSYRYYSGTNEWKLVQSSITDSDGKTVGFYEAETALYRHKIVVDGIVELNETVGRKMIPEDTPYTITFYLGGTVGRPWVVFDEKYGLTHGVSYNNETEIVTYSYTDTNTTFESSRFEVYEEKYSTDDVLICNTTSTLESTNINCDVSSYSGNFIARGYITRDGVEILVDTYRFSSGTGKDLFGMLGVLLGWFIILTSAMVFAHHPIPAIIMTNIAIIFVNIIGLVHFGGIFLFGIFSVSFITIWLLKN